MKVEFTQDETFEIVGAISMQLIQMRALLELGKLPDDLKVPLQHLAKARAKLATAAGMTPNPGAEQEAVDRAKRNFSKGGRL